MGIGRRTNCRPLLGEQTHSGTTCVEMQIGYWPEHDPQLWHYNLLQMVRVIARHWFFRSACLKPGVYGRPQRCGKTSTFFECTDCLCPNKSCCKSTVATFICTETPRI